MPNEIREIITKAVIGKGRLKNKKTYTLKQLEHISSILGCWIVNHQYQAELRENRLFVNGQFDLNIWYCQEDEKKSQVYVETVNYCEELKIVTKENVSFEGDLILMTTCPQSPVCLEAKLDEQRLVAVTVEKTLSVDIIGETKISIEVQNEPEIWDDIDLEVDPSFLEK